MDNASCPRTDASAAPCMNGQRRAHVRPAITQRRSAATNQNLEIHPLIKDLPRLSGTSSFFQSVLGVRSATSDKKRLMLGRASLFGPHHTLPSASKSLSGLGSVGCESTAAVHFSPSFCPIAGLWGCKSGKNCPRWGRFSLATPQARQAPSSRSFSSEIRQNRPGGGENCRLVGPVSVYCPFEYGLLANGSPGIQSPLESLSGFE